MFRNKEFAVITRMIVNRKVFGKGGIIPRKLQIFVGTTRVKLLINSESLFTKITWFGRLPVVLLSFAMTIPAFVLALVLSLALMSDVRAEESSSNIVTGTCNASGTCLWNLDSSGTLTIFAKDGAKNVSTDSYYCEGNPCTIINNKSRPWEDHLLQIKNVVIEDNITSIGRDAFQSAHNLQSVSGMKNLKAIDVDVFAYTGLTSLTLPDSVNYTSRSIFYGTSNLTELVIPDNWADGEVKLDDHTFEMSCFNPSYASSHSSCADAKIICQGDVQKCKTALAKFGGNGTCTLSTSYCISPDAIVAADYKYCTGNYFWNGAECIREPDVSKRTCCTSCKDMGGWCNRVIYTPAEAAAVLTDDNNNVVTITFKK